MFYRSLPLRAYEYGFSQETGDGVPQLRPWYPYLNEKIREKMGQNWEDSHQVASYGAIWVVKEALERVEWSEDQATFRTNLRDAIAAVDLTHDTAEKFTTPDGVTFCPAIDPTGHWDGLKFDETGQCVQDVGLISQNLGGTRWPMYPEKWRLSNSPSVVLPIPPWDER